MNSSVEAQLWEVLNEYQDELKEKVHDDFEEVGRETAEDLKTVSQNKFKQGPGRKHYWRGWTFKVRGSGLETTVTIYNSAFSFQSIEEIIATEIDENEEV